jgi:hypothetical protein
VKFDKTSILIALTILTISCSKEDPVTLQPPTTNNQSSNFIFYPTKDAIWIIKSHDFYPNGIYVHYDTLSLGKDTVMTSRTLNPNSNLWSDATPPQDKTYLEIVVNTMSISPLQDTSYSHDRFGWFRQDIYNQKIFTPRLNTNDNVIYEDLRYNFSLNTGDTLDFYTSSTALIAINIDSVNFGSRHLKRLSYGPPSSSLITGEIIQGFDFAGRKLNGATGISHPGSYIWKKFIYKSDTLLIHY